jgi:hypothetical protein
MYIIRDIFRLHFGHYRDAKTLVDEARKKNMMPQAKSLKLLTHLLTDAMSQGDWKMWYEKFKTHVRSSHREILKEVM